MKRPPQFGRKYLEITYPMKDLYLEHIKYSQNSIIRITSYYYISIRMVKIKRIGHTKYLQKHGGTRTSYNAGKESKIVRSLWKIVCQLLKKLNIVKKEKAGTK